MKLNNIYIIQFISALVLLLSSCSQEELIDQPDTGTGSGKIAIRLSLSQPGITRADTEVGEDDLNENLIKTLDVFIYREGQESCSFYEHITPSPEQTGSGEYTVTLGATQDQFVQNATYNTYVVTNYSGSIPGGGLTRSDLQVLNVTTLDPDKIQDSFLMDGTAANILNDGRIVNKEIAVALKRAAAKIRVSTAYTNGFSASTGGTMTKKLFQYVTNASVLENGSPVVPQLQSMSGFTGITPGTGTDKIIVYSYPNDWSLRKQNETYLIVNIPATGPDGTEYAQNYYKVPVNFRLPADDTANPSEEQEAERNAIYRLERNHLYDITVLIDQPGSPTPETAKEISANYTIEDWTTKEILVSVEGSNFIYVEDTDIKLPNSTKFTTTFQSSTPDVEISDITVNGQAIENGNAGVFINHSQGVKTGDIIIISALPENFVAKEIAFTVKNGVGLTQEVKVLQYPALYIGSDISADAPGGSQGQNNNKMFVIGSFVADFSSLPDPDEFDEDFGAGYTHYAANPALGKSYAEYIRNNAVLGNPLTDSNGQTIDTEENNRRISPRLMLASQHGVTTADSYLNSRAKCESYVENDATTNETYSDWRMPTLAEVYLIDVLQNIKVAEVKKILEGSWYWSAQASSTVQFMDPRVGNTASFNPKHSSVRCVRDVKF